MQRCTVVQRVMMKVLRSRWTYGTCVGSALVAGTLSAWLVLSPLLQVFAEELPAAGRPAAATVAKVAATRNEATLPYTAATVEPASVEAVRSAPVSASQSPGNASRSRGRQVSSSSPTRRPEVSLSTAPSVPLSALNRKPDLDLMDAPSSELELKALAAARARRGASLDLLELLPDPNLEQVEGELGSLNVNSHPWAPTISIAMPSRAWPSPGPCPACLPWVS